MTQDTVGRQGRAGRGAATVRLIVASVVLGTLGWAWVGLGYEPMRTEGGVRMAWPQEGGGARWRLCGDALVAGLGEEGALAAWEGALTWWTAGAFLEAVDIEAGACGLNAQDGRVAIVAVRQGWGEGFHMPAGLVGLTVHTFQVEGGGGAAEVATLLDADIALNLEGFLFSARAEVTGSFDVGAVVAHEMGHALGIGHPCGDGFGAYPSCAALPEEVLQALEVGLMFPGQAVGARGLALTEEDAQGLIAVWGAQRVGVSEGSDRVGWRVCEEAGTLRLGEGAGGDVRWRAVTANGEGEWRASAATSPQEGAARGFLIAAQGRGSVWRGQEVVRCDNGDQDTSPEADARGVEDEGAREDVGVDDAEGVIPPQAEGESAAQEVSDGCGCRVQIGGREESGRAGEWAWLWIGAMSCLGWMLGWLRVGPKTGRGA